MASLMLFQPIANCFRDYLAKIDNSRVHDEVTVALRSTAAGQRLHFRARAGQLPTLSGNHLLGRFNPDVHCGSHAAPQRHRRIFLGDRRRSTTQAPALKPPTLFHRMPCRIGRACGISSDAKRRISPLQRQNICFIREIYVQASTGTPSWDKDERSHTLNSEEDLCLCSGRSRT